MEKENQLIAELEWIKEIAQKIDTENHSLMKKYMDLKAQYSTQENDREILLRQYFLVIGFFLLKAYIREVLLKKKKNAILKSQIDQYEQALNEAASAREGGAEGHATSQMEKSREGKDSKVFSPEHLKGKETEQEE